MSTKNPLIICTHHKAGTALCLKIFKDIAIHFNKKIWMKFYEPDKKLEHWDICFHQHSRILDVLSTHNFKGLHCIRHPKALIYSATLYHQKCKEPWVDVPLQEFSGHTFWAITDGHLYNRIKNPTISDREKKMIMGTDYTGKTPLNFKHYSSSYRLNGKTYREYLSGLPSIEEKLMFEMKSFYRGVINGMLNFPSDRRFFWIQLETISKDETMSELRNAFIHLGYKGDEIEECLDISKKHCIWNVGLTKFMNHATTGVSDDWQKYFKGRLLEEYHRLFGRAEKALGYRD